MKYFLLLFVFVSTLLGSSSSSSLSTTPSLLVHWCLDERGVQYTNITSVKKCGHGYFVTVHENGRKCLWDSFGCQILLCYGDVRYTDFEDAVIEGKYIITWHPDGVYVWCFNNNGRVDLQGVFRNEKNEPYVNIETVVVSNDISHLISVHRELDGTCTIRSWRSVKETAVTLAKQDLIDVKFIGNILVTEHSGYGDCTICKLRNGLTLQELKINENQFLNDVGAVYACGADYIVTWHYDGQKNDPKYIWRKQGIKLSLVKELGSVDYIESIHGSWVARYCDGSTQVLSDSFAPMPFVISFENSSKKCEPCDPFGERSHDPVDIMNSFPIGEYFVTIHRSGVANIWTKSTTEANCPILVGALGNEQGKAYTDIKKASIVPGFLVTWHADGVRVWDKKMQCVGFHILQAGQNDIQLKLVTGLLTPDAPLCLLQCKANIYLCDKSLVHHAVLPIFDIPVHVLDGDLIPSVVFWARRSCGVFITPEARESIATLHTLYRGTPVTSTIPANRCASW